MVATVEPQFMECSDAARTIGVATTTLKKWEREGKLAPPIRTIGGRRLYTVEQVEGLRAERQARLEAGPPLDAA